MRLTDRVILLTYLRFYHGLKTQGISRDTFPYRAPFQPYLSYFGVSASCVNSPPTRYIALTGSLCALPSSLS